VKNLFNHNILKKGNYPTSVIPACLESFPKQRIDSGQAGMTKKESLNLGYINI